MTVSNTNKFSIQNSKLTIFSNGEESIVDSRYYYYYLSYF